MSNWKRTLIVGLIVFILVIIGMLIFVATEKQQRLSYGDAFDLCMQTITTIGYGNHIPQTAAGKSFCILFAITGIPLNFYLLKLIGEHMLNAQKHLITKLELRIFHREPRYLHEKCLVIGVSDIMALTLIGAGVQVGNANWDFLSGVWAYVITFTTVGFGDLIPHHDENNEVNMVFFLPIYYFLGLCVMSSIVQSAMGVVDSIDAVKRLFGYREVVNEPEDVQQDRDDNGGNELEGNEREGTELL